MIRDFHPRPGAGSYRPCQVPELLKGSRVNHDFPLFSDHTAAAFEGDQVFVPFLPEPGFHGIRRIGDIPLADGGTAGKRDVRQPGQNEFAFDFFHGVRVQGLGLLDH